PVPQRGRQEYHEARDQRLDVLAHRPRHAMLTHQHRTILRDIPDDWNASLLRDCVDLPHCSAGDWGEESGAVPLRAIRSTNFTNDGQLTLTEVATRYYAASKVQELSLLEN